MKKGIITTLLLVISTLYLNADDFKIRLIENEIGYMEVQMKCVNVTVIPTTSTPISGFTFQISWLSSLGADVDILCTSNPYNLEDGLGAMQTEGSYNYRTYAAGDTPFDCPTTWIYDEWETITSFIVTTGSGTGDFDVAPNGWVAQGLNWQIEDPVVFYNPDVESGIIGFPFPTLVYDRKWVGGSPGFVSDWWYPLNWTDECGNGGATPTASNNAYIPDISGGSGYFPSTSFIGPMVCNNLRIGNNAQLSVPAVNGSLTISGDLFSNGVLTIVPDANVTVIGDTYLGGVEALVVEATGDGVGSFFDNGTITYGTSGTAKVQAYLGNDAVVGKFHPHLVGPLVDMANYTGAGTGALLSAFDVLPSNTFAYEWDEPSAEWVNLSALTEEVSTGKGISLSTVDGFDHLLEMTGELITGALTSEPMTNTNLGDYLLSNPYPSSIFWDDMHGDNTGNVADALSVWDGVPITAGGTGSYKSYNTSSGGTGGFTGYIQVGQGFFVTSSGTNSFEFYNTQRHHSVDPFYAPVTMYTNRLDVRLEGPSYGDGLLVHFYEDALTDFDINEDIENIESRFEDAPEIWTELEDGSNLSINAMPVDLLGADMFSVPMSFKCGYSGTHTLSFLGLESFETGTEVWLEDKQTGEDWVSINNNPEYTFTAFPAQLKDRFIIHFFGPTGLSELDGPAVQIYSFGNHAYVVNDSQEKIKHVLIYNLTGELIMNEKVPDQRINKLFVSNKLGYFIVKVITDKNIYLEKVMISYY